MELAKVCARIEREFPIILALSYLVESDLLARKCSNTS
jgi:hypothetical protein